MNFHKIFILGIKLLDLLICEMLDVQINVKITVLWVLCVIVF